MPKTNTAGKTPRRSHSFGGCGTCRKRHVKCDQVRPTCLTCRAVGAVCMGYRSDLKWMNPSNARGPKEDTSTDPVTQSVRNHLFTEKARASMSTALQADLLSKPVDESISELDARSNDALLSRGESVVIGPFGVFSFTAQPPLSIENTYQSQDISRIESREFAAKTPQTVESIDSFNNLNDWLDWPDLFDLDFNSADLMPPDFDNPFDDAHFPVLQPLHEQAGQHQSSSADHLQLPEPGGELPTYRAHLSTVESKTVKAKPKDLKPADAELLLRHFQDHVLHQMVSLPVGKKSPWEITCINSAVLTLARVTYMTSQNVSRAALSNLLALCAIAAKHIATQNMTPNAEPVVYWKEFAARTIKEAKEDLQWSLRHETQGPGAAKYKDQLMAISALLAFAILYDRQQDARAYMIDAERLLRLRGLAKRHISRKARFLHHVYTWARILGESTYVLRNYRNSELATAIQTRSNTGKRRRVETDEEAIRDQEQQGGPNPRLDDFLRLEPNFPKPGKEMMNQKDNESGLHDIHLEDSREWPETLYLQLYGVSETWLSLVSQTTRLANVLDSLNAGKQHKTDALESVEKRKSRLENMICTFVATDDSGDFLGSQQEIQGTTVDVDGTGSAEARSCMLRAFTSALIIYFYRRIRNVNPWILQEHVNNVIRALKDFDLSCERHQIEGPGSPWPGFLAGCEAMSKVQREYFSNWFDKAFQVTGFTRLQTAKISMLEVWKRRDSALQDKDKKTTKTTDTVHSWVQVSRERNVYLLLT